MGIANTEVKKGEMPRIILGNQTLEKGLITPFYTFTDHLCARHSAWSSGNLHSSEGN